MFDFFTDAPPPVRVTINGTAYDLPRFLGADFSAWVAERQKATMDAALAEFGDDADARARFRSYFRPVPIDVAELADEAKTPAGSDYVIRRCLKAANVPDDIAGAFVANVHPETKRALAWHLASADAMAQAMKRASDDPGAAGNPTTGPAPTSSALPTTTPATDTPSPAPAPESSQAA